MFKLTLHIEQPSTEIPRLAQQVMQVSALMPDLITVASLLNALETVVSDFADAEESRRLQE